MRENSSVAFVYEINVAEYFIFYSILSKNFKTGTEQKEILIHKVKVRSHKCQKDSKYSF